MITPAPEQTMTPEEFRKLRDFFYRKTGIYFEDAKEYFVEKRIRERIIATSSDTFRSYFTLLRFETSGEELQQLVNLMTVNETYFFREEYQFKCLVNSLLNEAIARRNETKRLRILSLPCSTGEEPYSIAIYLLEYWSQVNNYEVEIVGGDIDTQVLDGARRGVYSSRSVQYMPASLLKKYFRPAQGGGYQICEELRNSIDFHQVNLSNSALTCLYQNFDVIFCRNLLIYFDDISRRQAAETFYDALRPGGFLCLGHSESMSRVSSLFEVRRFADAIVYQKPL